MTRPHPRYFSAELVRTAGEYFSIITYDDLIEGIDPEHMAEWDPTGELRICCDKLLRFWVSAGREGNEILLWNDW